MSWEYDHGRLPDMSKCVGWESQDEGERDSSLEKREIRRGLGMRTREIGIL